jgi:serine protease Do
MQPGDVVVEFNGKPVKDSDALVAMVVNTKPGTNVPVTVYRNNQRRTLNITVDELDLDEEQGRTARRGGGSSQSESTTDFGMTFDAITPDIARRMDLPSNTGGAIVTDVERNSPAFNGGVVPGDVILEVNRQKVANVSQITRELQRVQPGQPVFMLVWRDSGNVFITMTKR